MKICVICFGFKKENIRRQPWRYIYEVSAGLAMRGIELVVITDTSSPSLQGIKIRTVKKLRSFLGETREVLEVIREEKPDIVLMLLGLTSFLRLRFKIDEPVIGVLTSPVYSVEDVLKVGMHEFLRHLNYVFIHLMGALIPRFLIRKWANYFENIVVLSEENKRRLESVEVNTEISVIPPGIDGSFLDLLDKNHVEKLRTEINPENIPVILYFASPLTLRGTDILIKAFARVRKVMPCKLVILSRLEHEELVREEKLLKKLAKKGGITDSVVFISKDLNPEEVKSYICTVDIVCLPFKIVISDVPISILEAMALGKPVVSTNVGSIPELLNERGVVVEPSNHEKLADAVMRLLSNKELANEFGKGCREYMETYHSWEDVSEKFLEIIHGRVSN